MCQYWFPNFNYIVVSKENVYLRENWVVVGGVYETCCAIIAPFYANTQLFQNEKSLLKNQGENGAELGSRAG